MGGILNVFEFFLNLESTRRTLATSLFELATFAADIGLLVFVGTHAKVLDSLTSVLCTAKKDSVSTSGSAKSKLIKRNRFTASLHDTSSSGLGESKCSNRKIWDLQHTGIIRDGSNYNDCVALLALGVTNNARKRDGRSVKARHEKTLENYLVEVGIGTASKEAVKLEMGGRPGRIGSEQKEELLVESLKVADV
jgi:hypothetical protein